MYSTMEMMVMRKKAMSWCRSNMACAVDVALSWNRNCQAFGVSAEAVEVARATAPARTAAACDKKVWDRSAKIGPGKKHTC